MRVIVGCEYSQIVTKAFREKGHKAFSCDIIPCEGGHPEWHFQTDILKLLEYEEFDLGIFHPPCTYLTVTGNKWMKSEFKDRFPTRQQDRKDAIDFFMKIVNLPCNRIAIENPIGIMSTEYRKPDQIIQPYYFGDEARKSTCLWLKSLHLLQHSKESDWFATKTHVWEGEIITHKSGKTRAKWYDDMPKDQRAKVRSKTFRGIADAMANQWG